MKYSPANEYDLVFPFLMIQKALLVIVTRVITCTYYNYYFRGRTSRMSRELHETIFKIEEEWKVKKIIWLHSRVFCSATFHISPQSCRVTWRLIARCNLIYTHKIFSFSAFLFSIGLHRMSTVIWLQGAAAAHIYREPSVCNKIIILNGIIIKTHVHETN